MPFKIETGADRELPYNTPSIPIPYIRATHQIAANEDPRRRPDDRSYVGSAGADGLGLSCTTELAGLMPPPLLLGDLTS